MNVWRIALLPLLLFGACAKGTGGQSTEVYRGFYESGFEVESFQPCGAEKKWWVVGGEELYQRYQQLANRPYQRVFVVIRGQAGPRGRFGHLGAYTREIEVAEVVEMRPPGEADC